MYLLARAKQKRTRPGLRNTYRDIFAALQISGEALLMKFVELMSLFSTAKFRYHLDQSNEATKREKIRRKRNIVM